MAEKIAKPTAQQIADWKKQHGKVFTYAAADGKEAYFKPPTRKIIAAASVYAGGDAFLQQDTVAKNCFLGGDEAIVNEDKYLYSLGAKLDLMIDTVEGSLKEV